MSYFRYSVVLASILGVCLGCVPSTLVQTSPDANGAASPVQLGPDEQQLRERVRNYVARTTALVLLRDIEIAELGPPDAHGIRRVVVRLHNTQPPVTNVFYITADGGEILHGTRDELSSDPWSGMRDKLASLIKDAPANGPADAIVTLVEFGDFQCPFCAQLNRELERLRAAYPQSVRWIFYSYPLTRIHPWSQTAAISGDCVAEQGVNQFWKFERLVYQHQQEIVAETAGRQLRSLALQSGAAALPYDQCAKSPDTASRLHARIAKAEALGVTSTPTLFLNGRRITGAVSFDSLRTAVDDELMLTAKEKTGNK